MMEEKELVEKVIAGDADAEEKFFAIYRPRLMRASHFFLGMYDSEAEDVVQETLLIALPRLKNYDFRAPIFAWLRMICLRLCYARMRRRSRVVVSVREDLEIFMQRMAVERVQLDDLEVLKKQRLALLDDVKEQLNPASREIIRLRHVQGMNYAAIGRTLKIPLGTVMSRLARAKDQLRTLVKAAPSRSSWGATASAKAPNPEPESVRA